MPRRRLQDVSVALVAATLAAFVPAPPVAALQLPAEARFSVEFRGIRVGELVLRSRQSATGYAAAARLDSAGLAALIRPARFEAEVQGRIRAGRLHPERYREDVDTGRRASHTELAYTGGVPDLRAGGPEGDDAAAPWRLDPAAQAGTVDPMTALLLLLADVPPAAACRLDIALFDGRRRGRIALGDPLPAEGGLVCSGRYARVAGYSDEELAEGRLFAFRIVYRAGRDGLLRAAEIEADSLHGRARLVRR